MTLTEALTEFFGVPVRRAAIEAEMQHEPLAVVVSSVGARKQRTRDGFCTTRVEVTAYIRIGVQVETEIVEMLHHAFRHYDTRGRWQWTTIEITHGDLTLKSGSQPKIVPFYIHFDLHYKP